MTTVAELKKCPFCGKLPYLDKGYGGYAVLHSCDFIRSNIGRMKRDKVIEMWNTRYRKESNEEL